MPYYFPFDPCEKQDLAKLIPNADAAAIDLIEKMLTFNPDLRISADEILAHEYFGGVEEVEVGELSYLEGLKNMDFVVQLESK